MRHAGNGQVGHLDAGIQVHHLGAGLAIAFARTGRPQGVLVALVEKEIVQRLGQGGAAHVQKARFADAFFHFVVVHQAVVDGFGVFVVRDFPDFRDVFQGHDKAVARCRVVHRRGARAACAVLGGRVVGFHQIQIGIKQRQGVRQVVGRHDPLAIGTDGHVAHIQARPHLGHHLQAVQVVLGNPAIARAKKHVTPVLGEFGPAVQGKAAWKALDDFKLVAIKQGNVVVTAFHHDEQIHRIGLPQRRVGRSGGQGGGDARGGDVGRCPARGGHHRGANPVGQGLDFSAREQVAKAHHLRGLAALFDYAQHFGGAGAFQAFRQQGWAH